MLIVQIEKNSKLQKGYFIPLNQQIKTNSL